MPAQAPAPIAPAPAAPGTEARARPLGARRRPGGPRARGRRIALVAYYSFAALIIAALARFRSTLAPAWTYRDGVAASCRGSEDNERALDAIERLRYAEEHAARREAGDLAPLRRRVRAIVDGQLGPASPR